MPLTARQQELFSHCRCEVCPLFHSGQREPVFGHGPLDAKLIVIGEAPGKDEVKAGKPFCGNSGLLLDKVLAGVGNPRAATYVTNAVLCRPTDSTGKDAPPDQATIAACKPRLDFELSTFDPEKTIAVTVGASAATSLGVKMKNITDVQGSLQWVDKRWVMPAFHPAYILRQSSQFENLYDAFHRAVNIVSTEPPSFPDKELKYGWAHLTLEDSYDAMQMLQEIHNGLWGNTLAIDVETANTSNRSQLLQVAVANETKAAVFEADLLVGNNQCYDLFYDVLTDDRFTWVMHNSTFDLQFLKRVFGIHHTEIPHLVDTMCLALGLTELQQQVGLKYLSRKWLNAPYYEDELSPYIKNKSTPYTAIPRDVLAKYAAADVVCTIRLLPILVAQTQRRGTYDLSTGLLTDAQKAFADMEYDGCAINLDQVETIRAEMQPRLESLDHQIYDAAVKLGWEPGRPLNPGSTYDLRHLFYDIAGAIAPRTSKATQQRKDNRTTGIEFRDEYRNNPRLGPIVRLLDERATVAKMLRTYVEGIAKHVSPVSGRIHPSFQIGGTVTGRITIKNPALQTIPRETTTGDSFASIRSLFVPKAIIRPNSDDSDPEGFEPIFVAADYSQLELRIAWLLSGDKVLGEALKGRDFHTQTASEIYRVPIEQVTTVQRHNTKYVSFGLAYGRSAYSLHKGELNCTLPEAEAFVSKWASLYHVYWDYRTQLQIDAVGQKEDLKRGLPKIPARKGYLKTPFGRVRRFPFIASDKDRAHAMNQALNFPVQSTASDLTLYNTIKLNEALRKEKLGRVLFTVHDSIEMEVDNRYIDSIGRLIRDTLETLPPQLAEIAPSDFELRFDAEKGNSWGDAETWIM